MDFFFFFFARENGPKEIPKGRGQIIYERGRQERERERVCVRRSEEEKRDRKRERESYCTRSSKKKRCAAGGSISWDTRGAPQKCRLRNR